MLAAFLSAFPQINIVGTATSGLDVIELVEKLRPTAVFLEVDLPSGDGIASAIKLRQISPETRVVFLSVYPDYALEAFRVDAIDYILKPMSHASLARAVGKLEAHQHPHHRLQYERLAFKQGRDIIFVNLPQVLFLEKVQRRTLIHTTHGIYMTTESLRVLTQRLPHWFFRCHKSYVVNINHIERVYPLAERLYAISFYDYAQSITVARVYLDQLLSLLEQTRT